MTSTHSRIHTPPQIAAGIAIAAHYDALGAAGSFLGQPSGDLEAFPDGVGYGIQYAGGTIVWTSETGAHEVHGDIRGKWNQLGAQNGFLGYPLGDETGTPDRVGRYNHFQGGSVYWTPATGAHEVHGDIRGKWAELGWETSFLGYPVSDETGVANGGGRFNDFQGGSIYWSPVSGAHEMRGGLPGQLVFDSGAIVFGTGIAAGGSAHVTVAPDGSAHFQGGMHDSGAAAYNYSVACVLVDADHRAYTFAHTGNIAGTFESGSRDDPWDSPGQNGQIAQNWRSLCAGTQGHWDSRISADIQALLGSILTSIGTAAAVIAIIV